MENYFCENDIGELLNWDVLEMQLLNHIIEHYGYLGIVIALAAGVLGLPIPDEILLTFVGYNIFQGKLAFLPALLCSFAGASAGISLSYLLGLKLGAPFLHRYGPKIHITEERVERTRKLFERLGPILLFVGYFIPGVRHLTAYLSGINSYSYRKFALFAYAGAFTWCLTFLTLGKIFGENWRIVVTYLSKYSIYPLFILILGSLIVYTYRRKRRLLRNY